MSGTNNEYGGYSGGYDYGGYGYGGYDYGDYTGGGGAYSGPFRVLQDMGLYGGYDDGLYGGYDDGLSGGCVDVDLSGTGFTCAQLKGMLSGTGLDCATDLSSMTTDSTVSALMSAFPGSTTLGSICCDTCDGVGYDMDMYGGYMGMYGGADDGPPAREGPPGCYMGPPTHTCDCKVSKEECSG